MPSYQPRMPGGISLWIILCAFCSAAGWILSALRELNAAGYGIAFLLGLAAVVALRRRVPLLDVSAWSCCRLRRRFGRCFPLAFLILAALATLGGILYAPSNYDALTYRLPRLLNWLAEDRWHWVHTAFNRLNTRAPGFEWVAAPVIAFARTDRFLFLINVVSLLLLPGLVFSLFTRLGVRRRAAWYWMWLAPTGYCFLLQAGSIGNDLFGAVFGLAAVDFALRARRSGRAGDAWLSLLAVAVLTGSKASNLPLVLPWLVAVAPAWRTFFQRPLATAAIGLVAVLASLVPSAAMNTKYTGDWSGTVAEQGEHLRGHPLLRVGNHAVLLAIQNLAPPVFPFAGKWNEAMERLMPVHWRAKLERSFEPEAAHWVLGEMQIEEAAGLGFGVSVLLLLSAGAGWAYGRRTAPPGSVGTPHFVGWLVVSCTAVALLGYMAKAGFAPAARLVTPYYALLMPGFLLAPAQERVVRTRWWQRAALAVFVLAGVLLVISPARPLWPANAALASADTGAHKLLARAKKVYSIYGERADGFAPLRKLLPEEARVVGLVAWDDPETSLWRPFGQRRILHVMPSDSAGQLEARGIQYVVVGSRKFDLVFQRPFEQWLREMDAEVVGEMALALRAAQGPSDWYVVRLRTGKPK